MTRHNPAGRGYLAGLKEVLHEHGLLHLRRGQDRPHRRSRGPRDIRIHAGHRLLEGDWRRLVFGAVEARGGHEYVANASTTWSGLQGNALSVPVGRACWNSRHRGGLREDRALRERIDQTFTAVSPEPGLPATWCRRAKGFRDGSRPSRCVTTGFLRSTTVQPRPLLPAQRGVFLLPGGRPN